MGIDEEFDEIDEIEPIEDLERPGVWDLGDGEDWISPTGAKREFRRRTKVDLPNLPTHGDWHLVDGVGSYEATFEKAGDPLRYALSRVFLLRPVPPAGLLAVPDVPTLGEIFAKGPGYLIRLVDEAIGALTRLARAPEARWERARRNLQATLLWQELDFIPPQRDVRIREQVRPLIASLRMHRAELKRVLPSAKGHPRDTRAYRFYEGLKAGGLNTTDSALVCIRYEAGAGSLVRQIERDGKSLTLYCHKAVADLIRQSLSRGRRSKKSPEI